MAIQINAVMKYNGSVTPTAALLDGALAPATLFSGTRPRFDTGNVVPGRYGMRMTYPSLLDLATHDYVSIAYNAEGWGPAYGMTSVDSGGLRVIFVDSQGRYAGFNLYGDDVPGYSADNNQGYLASYASSRVVFHIARARTPDIAAGGLLDWSNIVALELSISKTSPWSKDAGVDSVVARSAPVVTGSVGLSSIVDESRSQGVLTDQQLISQSPVMQRNAAQALYSLAIGLTVGNGVTATNLTDSGFGVGFENPYELSASYPTSGPWVQLPDSHVRAFKIVQSAACVLSLTDGSFASAGWWQWELSGSGVATCTRVQYWRFDGFRAAHGHYVDCTWNAADSAVEVTAETVISGGLIRGAKSTALKITSAAGVYSGLELEIDGLAATYDVELGEGGAGTYELAKITVPDGYTLRVRNNSASNAVVVKLPLGLAYSTSTAGGAITVEIPEVSVDVVASALISGSRVQLYNVTDGIEMLNSVLPSSGLIYTAPYTGDKIVRLRSDHASKLPLETVGVLTASGLTFLDVQDEDDVYLGNGIDGGAVTEFTPDEANIQVDISDPDGVTNIQRLYAWLQWYMTTEEGIRSSLFGAVSAIDSANYVINQSKADLRLDNVSPMPVRVVGGYLSRKDGLTVIAPNSNSIQMDPGKAYAIETGVSGLTVDESNKLQTISTLNTSVEAVGLNVAQLQVTAGTILDKSTQTLAELSIVSDDVDLLLVGQASSTLAVAGVQTSVDSIHVPTKEAIAYEVWSSTEAQDIASGTKLDAVLDESIKIRQLAMNKAVVSEDGLTVVIYADDGVTPLQVFSISDDKRTRVPV